ncbi:MAG: hypothetical protein H7138_26020 [Myxococcales bacterium]|nr:hypothetical protein [Myxococcales bacterium]
MKTTNSLALVLALALGTTAAGCTADPSAMPADDDEQPGGNNDVPPTGSGGDPQPKPLEVAGTYTMRSTFDLATNMPGTAGEVVNTVIQLTDVDHGYPTKWLVDQMIGVLGDGTLKSTLQLLETLGVEWLNDKLLSFAPDFVGSALQIGNDFGDLAKHFGINETLTLTGSGSTYTAVHTITGVHFKLGTQEGDYAFANYGMANVVVNNVAVTMDATGQLTIAAHSLPIAYGRVLRLALDAAIIPLLDNDARNLNELFAHLINCDTVGDFIHDRFVIVPSSAVSAVCSLGLDAGAGFIYAKIEAIDATALTFGLSGTARAQDTNNDRKIDKIQSGAWSGTLTYGASPAPLLPAAFFGERN